MLGTPAFSTASTIVSPSAAVRASGFSQSTILPALAAAMAISAWRSLGTQMSMASMSLRSTSLRQSVSTRLVAPLVGEAPRPWPSLRAADRLAAPGGSRVSKKWATLAPGVGMGAAHEAVADHADVELLGHLPSMFMSIFAAYSRQPWASRTLTMAPRILFQVSCFSITALGNMQPSQQMWRIVLVRLPLSSRSQ